MDNLQYIRNKEFRLFGRKIFEIKEIISQLQFDNIQPIVQVKVSKEYYEEEFNIDESTK